LQVNYADTALVLFTRTPKEEARQKPLGPNLRRKTATSVFTRLICQAKTIALESGLPCFVVSSAEQRGSCFGERLFHALWSVLDRGFQSVIAIGNDCPQLSTREILAASALLHHQQAVLGPATDGGVYLLGVSREQLANKEKFLAVRWNSGYVQADLQQFLYHQHVNVALLHPLTDLDTVADLKAVVARQKLPQSLYRYFHSLLASLKNFIVQETEWQPASLFPSLSLSFRGPPARL
jgi:uncharacterized protein